MVIADGLNGGAYLEPEYFSPPNYDFSYGVQVQLGLSSYLLCLLEPVNAPCRTGLNIEEGLTLFLRALTQNKLEWLDP